MNTNEIKYVEANFGRIYLGGIPSLLNDDGAFLSFICTLTAIETLGGFLSPTLGNGPRVKTFVQRYFPDPYPSQADVLWRLRNTAVHGFSPGPYKLIHHNSHLHLTQDGGLTVLNAEDFYATLVSASKRYFDDVAKDSALQKAFIERINDPETGVLAVGPPTGTP
ncbi:MAG: hypothetical protein ABIH23_02590 [bacterium]